MAEWNTELPGTAVEGSETHVEDHNTIVAAIEEIRANADLIEASLDSTVQGLGGVAGLWTGTQAEFDALTPDANVVYIVVEG